MRIKDMRRSVAAIAALAMAGACTAQGIEVHGGQRQPVRIDGSSTPDGTPKQDDGVDGGDRAAGGNDGDGKGAPERAPTTAPPSPTPPPAPRPSPPPRVLWSQGDEGLDVRELQARLRQIAWLFTGPTGTYDDQTVQAVKGFQGKRGLPRTGRTDSVTWARLLNMTREPGKWDLYAYGGQPAASPDPRCLTGRVLCISKTSRTLRWMVDGRTLTTVEVRFGSEYTPTREGLFSVYFKSRDHWSTLYDTPMPYAMFFSGGQAVHYSADFAARGYYGASHGCVNVRDKAAIARLFEQVRNGDKVVVYW
ncbi:MULTISPECIES: L,D-transpeptidase family protein [Streptomyces]|uniref:L,D-transpeptidase family protein n=1 Tax=Streptomyces caniscabiei TaxID=2746961 RepID=A0ABU4MGA0_9ACTN|nr:MULTISPECIES: L,D-transpeptidase family protein [Streptomyces]MBE4737195.1 murein L,D-transpeptidase [Streptomyces caniscabiei]MBE4757569.1 murein L,D-transpeptidase [Streptomyces caniscabiei]MBE4771039.1 murein L,D-transpeptidase [Streptomyces caniscabiei]MBE4786688.1 murein L,D-transpeptidase [Streptomyces caniscabiei]MBE4795058.1 murein L,D-transpeptidase [Streptomyces caniscabiei]